MKRLFKILVGLMIALVVLVGALVLVAPSLLESQEMKAELSTQVRAATGREFILRDEIELTVFPWLGVKLGGFELGNAAGFAEVPFVSSRTAHVRVKLIPLLRGKVEMDTVTVSGLRINLARNEDGLVNWADLQEQRGAEAPSGPSPVAALAIGGLDVRDSTLSWDDRAAGTRVAMNIAQLTSGPVALGQPIELAMEFDIESSEPQVVAHVVFSGALDLDLENNRFVGKDVSVDVKAKGAGLPEQGASAVVKTDLVVDLATQRVEFQGLSGALPEAVIAGLKTSLKFTANGVADPQAERIELNRLSADGAVAGAVVPGGRLKFEIDTGATVSMKSGEVRLNDLRLGLTEFNLNGLSGNLALSGQAAGNLNSQVFSLAPFEVKGLLTGNGLPESGDPIKVSGSVDADLKKDSVDLRDIVAKALDMTVAFSGRGQGLRSEPTVTGTLDVQPLDARLLSKRLGIELPPMGDAKALQSVALKSKLRVSPAMLRLDDLNVRLDGTRVSGKLSLPLAGTGPVVGDIRIDELNADRYLPPVKASVEPTANPGAAGVAALQLPLELLRKLDIDARLRAGQITVTGIALNKVDLGLRAKAGLLTAKPLAASLAGGRYRGHAVLDARRDSPVIIIDETLENVNFGNLLAAFKQKPGMLDGASGNTSLKVKASLDPKINEYRLQGIDLRGNLRGEALPGKEVGFSLGGDATVNLNKQTLKTPGLTAKLNGVPIQVSLAMNKILDNPAYRGRIELPPFNPRLALTRFDIPVRTADRKALSRASATADIQGGLDSIALSNLALKLDDTNLTGDVSVANPTAPMVRFDLNVDGIDVDRYLPPESAGKGATPAAAAAAAGGLPMQMLRALDVEGRLSIGILRMAKLKISALKLNVKGKDGRIRLNPATARMYQGSYSGNIGLDATGERPALSLDEKLIGIQAEPLLRDLQGKAWLSGKGDVTARMTAVGQSQAEITRSLLGRASFDFRNGAYKGVNVARMVRGIKARFKGQPPPADNERLQTDFSELSGTILVKDGVATNRDLLAKAPYFRFAGTGNANLMRQRVDYRLSATVINTSKGQGGRELRDMEGLEIPVRIRGVFKDIDYELDSDRLFQSLAKREVNKNAGKITEKLTDKLGGQGGEVVDGLLKGLFN